MTATPRDPGQVWSTGSSVSRQAPLQLLSNLVAGDRPCADLLSASRNLGSGDRHARGIFPCRRSRRNQYGAISVEWVTDRALATYRLLSNCDRVHVPLTKRLVPGNREDEAHNRRGKCISQHADNNPHARTPRVGSHSSKNMPEAD